jgi:hypothetical protein
MKSSEILAKTYVTLKTLEIGFSSGNLNAEDTKDIIKILVKLIENTAKTSVLDLATKSAKGLMELGLKNNKINTSVKEKLEEVFNNTPNMDENIPKEINDIIKSIKEKLGNDAEVIVKHINLNKDK